MWTLTYASGNVVLSRNPERVELRNVAIVESLEIPGDTPFLLGLGKESEQMSIQGRLTTNSGIVMLKDMVFKEVSIIPHDSLYSGTWICKDFTVGEEQGVPNVYPFSMTFVKGSDMLTLG